MEQPPHKPSGMEMMLMSLMRSAGFDPNEIAKNIALTVKGFQDATTALALRLEAIDQKQNQIAAQLERIELALEIRTETGDTVSEHRRISNG